MPLAEPVTSAPAQTQATDNLLGELVELTQTIKALEERKRSITDQLSTLYELGQLEGSLQHAGHAITWSPGRKSYSYPAQVVEAEARLMELKEASVANQTAVLKPGSPFWSVRAIKPAKGTEAA